MGQKYGRKGSFLSGVLLCDRTFWARTRTRTVTVHTKGIMHEVAFVGIAQRKLWEQPNHECSVVVPVITTYESTICGNTCMNVMHFCCLFYCWHLMFMKAL